MFSPQTFKCLCIMNTSLNGLGRRSQRRLPQTTSLTLPTKNTVAKSHPFDSLIRDCQFGFWRNPERQTTNPRQVKRGKGLFSQTLLRLRSQDLMGHQVNQLSTASTARSLVIPGTNAGNSRRKRLKRRWELYKQLLLLIPIGLCHRVTHTRPLHHHQMSIKPHLLLPHHLQPSQQRPSRVLGSQGAIVCTSFTMSTAMFITLWEQFRNIIQVVVKG